MFNDLLFPILPKEGKVAVPQEQMRIKRIAKEGKLRPLNDEEKGMSTDEREIHDVYHKYQDEERDESAHHDEHAAEHREKDSAEKKNDKTDTDDDGWTDDGHLDIYV